MTQRIAGSANRIGGAAPAAAELLLPGAPVLVELLGTGTETLLSVRSSLHGGRSFLIPVGRRPQISGVFQQTNLGWFGGVCWALAFGGVALPAGSTIWFSTDTLRWRSEASRQPTALADGYWVAAAEGAFATARIETATDTVATTRLAGSW